MRLEIFFLLKIDRKIVYFSVERASPRGHRSEAVNGDGDKLSINFPPLPKAFWIKFISIQTFFLSRKFLGRDILQHDYDDDDDDGLRSMIESPSITCNDGEKRVRARSRWIFTKTAYACHRNLVYNCYCVCVPIVMIIPLLLGHCLEICLSPPATQNLLLFFATKNLYFVYYAQTSVYVFIIIEGYFGYFYKVLQDVFVYV